MKSGYISAFLRYEFSLSPDSASLSSLVLRAYFDDGCVVYINGKEVQRFSLSGGNIPFPPPSGFAKNHEASWEEVVLTGTASYLLPGTNTLAIQFINSSIGSSDVSIDAELRTPHSGVHELRDPRLLFFCCPKRVFLFLFVAFLLVVWDGGCVYNQETTHF